MTHSPESSTTGQICAPENTSGLAAISLVLSLVGIVFSPAAVAALICGHLSLNRIRQTGANGRKLALAAVIIGYVSLAAYSIALLISLAFLAALVVGGAAAAFGR